MKVLRLIAVVVCAACDPQVPASSTSNSILVTITGEESATRGTGFPPSTSGGEPYFIDGWEMTYHHVLVTIGEVTLSENPDAHPNDPSTTGVVVAQALGPWAIDLAKEGPLQSKEQNGHAWPLTTIAQQNKKTGSPAFDITSKYAFGYSLVAAAPEANTDTLDAQAQAAYQAMIQNGWTVLLQGTATWKGAVSAPACRSSDTHYDFERLPRTVNFSFGFAAPVYFRNCVNPELQPENSRGIQTVSNGQTVAQITFHLEHPFWEALTEDSPLRWDIIAAQKSVASGSGAAISEVTEADLAIDISAPRDAQQQLIPWRTCGPSLSQEHTVGTVSYDPNNVPINPAGGQAGLRDLADYMKYNLSTFGHLNNDGLCFPERQYPSPP